MAHSHVSALFHCVFSTKGRKKWITPELQDRLWPYIGGIASENECRMLAIGGVEDHVHVVLSLPSSLPVAKAVQLIKGSSSKWIHEHFQSLGEFAWQEGYGAFSVGVSQLEDTQRYVARQREHHRTRTFQEEFEAILRKHGIVFDERFVCG